MSTEADLSVLSTGGDPESAELRQEPGEAPDVERAPGAVQVSAQASVEAPRAALRDAVLLGWLASLFCALPASLRTGPSAPLAPLVLWGSAGLLIVPAGVLGRIARPFGPGLGGALLGGLATLGPLAWLGALLQAHTHHRPLGAVVFAVLALLTLLAAAWFGARLRAVAQDAARRQRPRLRLLVAGVLTGAVAVSLLATAALARRAFGEPGVTRGMLDVLLVVGAVALVVRAHLPAPLRRLRAAAPWLWASVALAALLLAGTVPAQRQAATARSPLLMHWLGAP